MFWNTLIMAFREIRRNTMRSLLTMLGIVIGVGAVIGLVTVGDGTTASVTAGISALGENLMMILPGARGRMGGGVATPAAPLTAADVIAVERDIKGIVAIAPTSSKAMLIVAGNQNWRTTVTGTVPAYLVARGFSVGTGRDFSPADLAGGTPVCLLGATPAKELFGSLDPLGQTLRLGKVSCTVIGVLTAKGAGAFGNDNDDLVIIPLKAFQQRIAGNRDITMIYLTVSDGRATSAVKSQITALMRERRRIGVGDEDDFNVRDMQEIIATVGGTTSLLTALLGAVAAVSLLVGGIGIMNIMLVSVTERTREIGIRLAIGALGREVLWQFLVESTALSMLGGLIGVALGLLGAFATTRAFAIPFLVSPAVVGLSFAFSAAVGMFFGFLPARKAARFNPIDALRHE